MGEKQKRAQEKNAQLSTTHYTQTAEAIPLPLNYDTRPGNEVGLQLRTSPDGTMRRMKRYFVDAVEKWCFVFDDDVLLSAGCYTASRWVLTRWRCFPPAPVLLLRRMLTKRWSPLRRCRRRLNLWRHQQKRILLPTANLAVWHTSTSWPTFNACPRCSLLCINGFKCTRYS